MNPYIPYPVRIEHIAVENDARDLKTFKLAFLDPAHERAFAYLPGQFAELSLAGYGEAPIGIASSPTEEGYLLFTVKRVRLVTTELHASSPGRVIGLRGPLGKPYPWREMEGRNIVVVGGGFAFTTLRSALVYLLQPQNRERYGAITAIYGARSPGELLYKDELAKWQGSTQMKLVVTVDRGADGGAGARVSCPGAGRGRAVPGGHGRPGLRTAGDDQVHPAGAGAARVLRGADRALAGDADEVRHRQVRPLQHRERYVCKDDRCSPSSSSRLCPTSTDHAPAHGSAKDRRLVCHCGSNIASKVDVVGVADYASRLPTWSSRASTATCARTRTGADQGGDRAARRQPVVVSACSPRMHELTFRKACESAGLNPYLYEHCNIREHCSWVHDDRGIATAKAKDLVRAAVRRVGSRGAGDPRGAGPPRRARGRRRHRPGCRPRSTSPKAASASFSSSATPASAATWRSSTAPSPASTAPSAS